MHTLLDVRYVPELKNDVISLETLDDIECKYTAECEVPKISRGAMVVMKGKKVKTHLLGETVTEVVAVLSSELNSNLTQLWRT